MDEEKMKEHCKEEAKAEKSTEICSTPDANKETSPAEDKLASTFATFWNICNTIQGLPILVIPYAVRNGGYLAVLTLLLVAAASNYTGKTIVRCLYEKDSKTGTQRRDIGNSIMKPSVILLRLSLIATSVIFAASFPAYTYLLAFVGSIAGISLEFIFPALFHLKIYSQEMSWCNIVLDGVVFVVGISVSVTGAFFSGRSMINTYSQPIINRCS
ncbi:hypothetical protein ACROYT_G019196 [Oculina patagonica]